MPTFPLRQFAEQLIEVFRARGVRARGRKDVIRLVITEGARAFSEAWPEFYYREVIARVLEAVRALLRRAVERG